MFSFVIWFVKKWWWWLSWMVPEILLMVGMIKYPENNQILLSTLCWLFCFPIMSSLIAFIRDQHIQYIRELKPSEDKQK
jgi:hypothetical protein